jgi:hypothetical protein
MAADHNSMRHGHGCGTHHARGRCIRRQQALSLAAAGIHDVFGPRYRVLVTALLA